MANAWPEIQAAAEKNRYELILSGPDISKRLERDGLDCNLFKLTKLNFLEISRTSLSSLPDEFQGLANVSKLSLHSNKLSSVPSSLGHLTQLKHLDLSSNQLESLPDELGLLVLLHNLNISSNRLVHIPPIKDLTKLVILDISHNNFDEFPSALLSDTLEVLAEIRARGNQLTAVPAAVSQIQSLKVLDVEDNKVKTVAGELGDAPKIKEIYLKGNPLTDRRLLKLIENSHHKQVIDYIRSHCPREKNEDSRKSSKTKTKKKKPKAGGNHSSDVDNQKEIIMVLHARDDTPKVVVQDAVKDVRPYIVCCILKNLDFETEGRLKRFMTLQTKIHDDECQKRTIATIATHDLSKIVGDVVYDAQPPTEILITPLSKWRSLTALNLYQQLQKEADQLRKEKKRNTYSGIHKYLHLLEEKPVFPCLVNSNGVVMSLPPLTNCNETKLSPTTRDVFVEVTSSLNINSCKQILDVLIRETAKLHFHVTSDTHLSEEAANKCCLLIQQVRVVDKEGHLRVVYPARPDLPFEEYNIIHEAKKA